MAAINEPVSPKELVTTMLRGLGPDYKMLVMAILNFPPLPDFADLRARLLAFDAQAPRIIPDQNTALMATQSSPHTTGHTSFPSHRGGGSSSNMRGGWYDHATDGMAPSSLNGLINRRLILLQVLDLKSTGLPFSLLRPNLPLLANTLPDPTQLLVSWDPLGAPPAILINILLQHVPIATMAQNPFLPLLGLNSCSHLTLLSTLTQGPSKAGLYPLSLSSHSSTVPHALTTVHSPAWHHRLGHPSHHVLSHLAPSLGFKVAHAFCKDCALSKSTKLSFVSNKNVAQSPFYLIHSDVTLFCRGGRWKELLVIL
ncbi:unnamed protein product [Prunus armeniaca]